MDDLFADGLPTLDTPRLRLRHPRLSDADALFSVFSNADALRYWSHGPLVNIDAARAYLTDMEVGFQEERSFRWAIAEQETDQLIGTVTLLAWSKDNRRAEIGFVLHPAYHGRGLATEAIRTVLAFGFGPMDLHRVEADVDPANEGSLRLLERIGFQREGLLRQRWFTFGTWKDTVLLGLLAEDFASS
ncbi:MAG: GNAT family protein [Rubricoccaceae bacterium]